MKFVEAEVASGVTDGKLRLGSGGLRFYGVFGFCGWVSACVAQRLRRGSIVGSDGIERPGADG